MASRRSSDYRGDWPRIRRAFIKENGRVCEVCLSAQTSKGQRFHVHHMLGVGNDPEGKHLMGLCPTCHEGITLIHRRTRRRLTSHHVQEWWRIAQIRLQAGTSRRPPKDSSTGSSPGTTSTRKRAKAGDGSPSDVV